MSTQENLKSATPKHLEMLDRVIWHAPHEEAFVPDVKSQVSKAGWQGYKSTPTLGRSGIRAPNLVGRAVDIPSVDG
jgi:hypothetical protein